MSEYRIDLKVRNNVILDKIEKAGYGSVGEFCRLNDAMRYVSNLGKIINMKKSPLLPDGNFRKSICWAADILNCSPYDLFTDTQLHTVIKTNKKTLKINEAEMRFMLENQVNQNKLLENMIHEEQRSVAIEQVLESLLHRERKVIEMRKGLGIYDREYPLHEIGEVFGITPNRVRQIESAALRKLRHPSRSEDLKEFYY